jgi:hypothetical protein
MSDCDHEWESDWIEYEDDVCTKCDCSRTALERESIFEELLADRERLEWLVNQGHEFVLPAEFDARNDRWRDAIDEVMGRNNHG